MRGIAVTVGAILGCTVACWSQSYYEASGQTQVFTLTAGAKAGPAAIRRSTANPGPAVREVKIAQLSSGMVTVAFSLTGQESRVAVIDVYGRQVYRTAATRNGIVRIDTKRFTPGMYGVVVTAGSQTISRCVLVCGKGGR